MNTSWRFEPPLVLYKDCHKRTVYTNIWCHKVGLWVLSQFICLFHPKVVYSPCLSLVPSFRPLALPFWPIDIPLCPMSHPIGMMTMISHVANSYQHISLLTSYVIPSILASPTSLPLSLPLLPLFLVYLPLNLLFFPASLDPRHDDNDLSCSQIDP